MNEEHRETMRGAGRSLNSQFQTSVSYGRLEEWVAENLLKRLRDSYLIPHSRITSKDLVTSLSGSVSPFSTLWGVSFNGDKQELLNLPAESLDVRLVRGPWTAAILEESGHKVDSCYGDAVLLFSFLFPEFEFSAPRKATGILLAIEGNLDFIEQETSSEDQLTFLDPNDLPIEQVEKIIGSELVLSSSVTIVAIAESFGVPARFINPNNDFGMYFSQRDYLAGTDRPYEVIMDAVEDSLTLGGFSSLEVDINRIRDSFPKYLWEENQSLEPALQGISKELISENSGSFYKLLQSITNQQIPVESYVELLEDLILNDQSFMETQIDELSDVRYWLEPNLDLTTASYEIQALDYTLRMNRGKVGELLKIQSNGLIATLYSRFSTDCGTLVSLVLESPKILDIPVLLEINLPLTNRTVSVPIPSKTIQLGQTLIDIDVILEDVLSEDVENMGVVLHFEEGSSLEAEVELGLAPWSDPKQNFFSQPPYLSRI